MTSQNYLLRINGLHTMWARRRRLYDHATYIFNVDRCIERQGTGTLSAEELRWVSEEIGDQRDNL